MTWSEEIFSYCFWQQHLCVLTARLPTPAPASGICTCTLSVLPGCTPVTAPWCMSRDKLEFTFIPCLSPTLAFPLKPLLHAAFLWKAIGAGQHGNRARAWVSSPGSLRCSGRINTLGETYLGRIVIRTVMLSLGTRYRLSQCLPLLCTFPYLWARHLAPNLSQDAGPSQKLVRRSLEFRLKWQLGHKAAWQLPEWQHYQKKLIRF